MDRLRVPIGLLACLALVVGTLSVPMASAAHEHTHRYMAMGRVLGAEDLPAEGVPVRIELVGSPEAPPARSVSTNCQGDFLTVFAIDDLGASRVRITVNDETFTRPVDTILRRTFFHAEINATLHDRTCQETRESFENRQTVTGRVLLDGQPRIGVNVTVQLELPSGGSFEASGDTNEAGDYAIEIRSSELEPGTEAVVLLDGQEAARSEIDARFGITVIDVTQSTTTDAPAPGVLVAVVVGAAVALILGRR